MKLEEAFEVLFENEIEDYEYDSKFREYLRSRKFKFKVGDKVTNAVPLRYGSTLDAEIVEIIPSARECYKVYDKKSHGYTWWKPIHLKALK